VTDKASMRAAILAARAAMPAADRMAARRAIRAHVLSYCARVLPAGAWVAAYQPLRTEPGSTELLTELAARGHRVMVPVTLPDRDLDWAWFDPDQDQPIGSAPARRLGSAAVADTALVLAPACAVDRRGNRLGRGGGSYDRALGRLPDSVVVAALLFTSELVDSVPTDKWDRPVSAVVTPAGWITLTPTGRRNSP
jgi:5-formyltetrahydrofolate cyclo-ligase